MGNRERLTRIFAESSETIALYFSGDREQSDLVDAGFTCAREEFNDRYGIEVTYEHRIELRKTDPRIAGKHGLARWRGSLFRVGAEQGGQLLLVAAEHYGAPFGFIQVWGSPDSVTYRWIPVAEVERVR